MPRDESKDCQRRVAPADVRGCVKHRAEFSFLREFDERRSGIGDCHEVLAGFGFQLLQLVPEIKKNELPSPS